MKKIIEVIILLGGLMIVSSCSNPSSSSDNSATQNSNNTEVQNGGDNGNGNGTTDNPNGGNGSTTDPQNTNIINGTYVSNTRKFTFPIENVLVSNNGVTVNHTFVWVRRYSKSNLNTPTESEKWMPNTFTTNYEFSTTYTTSTNIVTIEFTNKLTINTISSFECKYDTINHELRVYY